MDLSILLIIQEHTGDELSKKNSNCLLFASVMLTHIKNFVVFAGIGSG
jgi:hypothetical protein